MYFGFLLAKVLLIMGSCCSSKQEDTPSKQDEDKEKLLGHEEKSYETNNKRKLFGDENESYEPHKVAVVQQLIIPDNKTPMESIKLPPFPKKLSYAACIYSPVHKSIFVLGNKGCTDCYKYDIQTSCYLKLESYPHNTTIPTTHTILSLNDTNYNQILSLGGSSNHFLIYDVNNNSWDQSLNFKLLNNSCKCSIGVAAVGVNNDVHIINGCSAQPTDAQYSYQVIDFKKNDTSQEFVYNVPQLSNRVYLKGLIHCKLRNSLIYFGGMQPGICTSLDTIYELKLDNDNKNNNKWELMNIKLPVAISAFGYTKIDIGDREWVVMVGGGCMIKKVAQQYYDTIYVWDINNYKFYELNERIYGCLAGIGCVYDSINGNLHIIGGGKGNESYDNHIMYNIGMIMSGHGNVDPITYREIVWETIEKYDYYGLFVPLSVLKCLFDMIDDGLLLPLLLEKPYQSDV